MDSVTRMAGDDKASGEAALGVPGADDEERLRGMIRAELDRQRAAPLARRTLELLIEAAAEPAVGSPGYRIVDRGGATRFRAEPEPEPIKQGRRKGTAPAPVAPAAPVPMTLADLVAELRERRPALFLPPLPPEPEPEPTPKEPARDPMAGIKAASARFIETRSALARNLATTFAAASTTRGQALARTIEGWRAQVGTRLRSRTLPATAADAPPAPGAAASSPSADQVLPGSDGASRRSDRGSGQGARIGTVLAEGARRAGGRRGVLAGISGLTALAVIVAVVTIGGRLDGERRAGPTDASPRNDSTAKNEAAKNDAAKSEAKNETARSETTKPAETPSTAPATSAAPPAGSAAPPPVPDADAEGAGSDEAPRRPGDLAGVPEVIDTATLRLGGKTVRLFGVEWVRGAQTEELKRYLAGRAIACRPAPGSSAHLCTVDGRDLSEVVLFNGGGRASSEATPDLVAAEDHARSERLGVWKR